MFIRCALPCKNYNKYTNHYQMRQALTRIPRSYRHAHTHTVEPFLRQAGECWTLKQAEDHIRQAAAP